MENVDGFDQRAQMINELLQGLEFAKQLHNHITNKPNYSSSDDNQVLNYSFIIEKMLSTFDKTITLAKQINPSSPNNDQAHLESLSKSLDVNSPRSENSRPNVRATKRRKMMRKWTKTVKVGPGKSVSGLEGPFADGFSWRKYGQKQILGAKFPRGYYRCTHRHSKGCPAKKQVQQSDEDQSIYQVMYAGEHTCYPGPNLQSAQSSPGLADNSKSEPQAPTSPQQLDPTIQEVYLGLSPEGDLKIETDESIDKAQMFRCFSFKSAFLEVGPFDILGCSTDLASTTTSGSNYFSSDIGPYAGLKVQTSESDINDPISGQNSVTNSPTVGDFEFPHDQWLDIDPKFFKV
ncbi:putative WRKY transcription factor 41 [Silene latifolia]|uniref:putative WRKY transcription factor 41 n=1 Tax=Silene latifolia TaxID=37657 RepID=UPI003D777E8B